MKYVIFFLSFLLITQTVKSQKTESIALNVRCVKELNDCFLVLGYDSISKKYYHLYSIKENIDTTLYCGIITANSNYVFHIEIDLRMSNPPDSNFTLLYKRDVLWKLQDGISNMPRRIINLKGRTYLCN